MAEDLSLPGRDAPPLQRTWSSEGQCWLPHGCPKRMLGTGLREPRAGKRGHSPRAAPRKNIQKKRMKLNPKA